MRKRQAKKIRIAENRSVRRYRRKTSEAAFRAVVKARRKRCRRDSLVAFWRHTWGGGFDPGKGQDFTAWTLVFNDRKRNDQSDALVAAVLALRQYDKPPVKQPNWPGDCHNGQQTAMHSIEYVEKSFDSSINLARKHVLWDATFDDYLRRKHAEMLADMPKHVQRMILHGTQE